MKNKWIRGIIGGLSFTSALFIFQACYGTPQDFGLDLLVEGQVKSKTSGLPVGGIKVSTSDNNQYEYTDETGNFSFYTEMSDKLTLMFEDIDSDENGSFINRDTVLTSIQDKVFVNIKMDEQ